MSLGDIILIAMYFLFAVKASGNDSKVAFICFSLSAVSSAFFMMNSLNLGWAQHAVVSVIFGVGLFFIRDNLTLAAFFAYSILNAIISLDFISSEYATLIHDYRVHALVAVNVLILASLMDRGIYARIYTKACNSINNSRYRLQNVHIRKG